MGRLGSALYLLTYAEMVSYDCVTPMVEISTSVSLSTFLTM